MRSFIFYVITILVIIIASSSVRADVPYNCKYERRPRNAQSAFEECDAFLKGNITKADKYLATLSRGELSLVLGKLDNGLSDLSDAYTLSQNLEQKRDVINTRGEALYQAKRFDDAVAEFSKLIALEPKNQSGYTSRGIVYDASGNFPRALADLTKGVELSGSMYSSARSARGLLWTKRGEYDKALLDFDQAIKMNPNTAVYYSNRGIAWRLKGDLSKALADQTTAVDLEKSTGQSTLTYVTRSDTLRYMGAYDEAIAGYQSALKNNSKYVPAYTGLGLTYERQGNLNLAKNNFRLALEVEETSRYFDSTYSDAVVAARAHLAALESGETPVRIQLPPLKVTNATSIPTPKLNVQAGNQPEGKGIASTSEGRGKRVALVIGNSSYSHVPPLTNPEKDADAISAELKKIGFDTVTSSYNLSREGMINALRSFANEAEQSEWAMVYYAGHGMEVGGVNYLIPIDAKLAVDRDIQFEAVPLNQILSATDAAKKIKLIMLDACRDNPFKPRQTTTPEAIAVAGSTAGSSITSRSTNGRGLAEVKVTGATLVVYAAKDGQVALDGEGGNSPFAVAVVQRLATPGVEINKLFRLVRDDVMEATAGRQEPYTYGSLPGKEDFYFIAK